MQGRLLGKNNLILLCICSLLGSRLLDAVGMPSIVNFVHFAFFILAVIVGVNHLTIQRTILNVSILLVFCTVVISSVFNFIAPLNLILTLLILLEPFVISSLSKGWSSEMYIKIENILCAFSLLNLLISYVEYFILGYIDDAVSGIFVGMGSGAHINGSFSMLMGIYYIYAVYKKSSRVTRIKGMILGILHFAVIVMCDNKQSIMGFGIGLAILLLLNAKDVKKFLCTLFVLIVGVLIVYILTFSVLGKIMTWVSNPAEMIMGINAKLSFIESLNDFRENPVQFLFGFGPGMTLSRVARILPDYQSLSFLGVTYSDITQYFKMVYANSWIMISSSMWAFYFSYASFFGDLGIVGLCLIVKMYLSFYKQFCTKSISKLLWATVLAHGFIFDWLEEPSFLLPYFLVILLINFEITDYNLRKRIVTRLL